MVTSISSTQVVVAGLPVLVVSVRMTYQALGGVGVVSL